MPCSPKMRTRAEYRSAGQHFAPQPAPGLMIANCAETARSCLSHHRSASSLVETERRGIDRATESRRNRLRRLIDNVARRRVSLYVVPPPRRKLARMQRARDHCAPLAFAAARNGLRPEVDDVIVVERTQPPPQSGSFIPRDSRKRSLPPTSQMHRVNENSTSGCSCEREASDPVSKDFRPLSN